MVEEDPWDLWKGVVGKKSPRLGMAVHTFNPNIKIPGDRQTVLYGFKDSVVFLAMFQDSYSETKSKKSKAWDCSAQL